MNKIQTISIITLLSTITFFSAKESITKNKQIENGNNMINNLKDSLKIYKKKFREQTDSIKQKEIKTITLVRENVKLYNPDVTNKSIKQFLKTIKQFHLSDNEQDFKLLLSQLIYESGFQQYYSSKHYKAGQLVVSNTNAIGICQIVPTTGYYYLKLIKNSNDLHLLKELGCSNLSIINEFKNSYPNHNQRQKVSQWLSIEKNNFALWGYIIKYNLEKEKDFSKTFVAYNAGNGYLNNYIKKGKNPNLFNYVVKINKIARKILI